MHFLLAVWRNNDLEDYGAGGKEERVVVVVGRRGCVEGTRGILGVGSTS